jgi:NAD dependent epimerase/dehydratase family enzyme
MILYGLENQRINGIYNAVSPNLLPMKHSFFRLEMPMYGKGYLRVYVPKFMIKLLLGDRSVEVLKSATVSPNK